MKKFILIALCLVFSLLLVSCTEEQGTKDISKVVVFDANGGKLNCDIRQRVQPGCQLELVKEPTREGYSFDGWYLGDEKWSFISDVVTIDLILKAHWTVNQYKLKIDYDTDGIENQEFLLDYDSVIKVDEIIKPVRNGYKIVNWGDIDNSNMPAHDVKFKALWFNDFDYILEHSDLSIPTCVNGDFVMPSSFTWSDEKFEISWTPKTEGVTLKALTEEKNYQYSIKNIDELTEIEMYLNIDNNERIYTIKVGYVTIEEIAEDYMADFNALNSKNYNASQLDTAFADSSEMAKALSDTEMVAKWSWLYNAIIVATNNPEMSVDTADVTSQSVKGYYLANLCGLFTGTQHTDTYFSVVSYDWSNQDAVYDIINSCNK